MRQLCPLPLRVHGPTLPRRPSDRTTAVTVESTRNFPGRPRNWRPAYNARVRFPRGVINRQHVHCRVEVGVGSCVTSIAGPNGGAQLYER